jgi:hypothetical protein
MTDASAIRPSWSILPSVPTGHTHAAWLFHSIMMRRTGNLQRNPLIPAFFSNNPQNHHSWGLDSTPAANSHRKMG